MGTLPYIYEELWIWVELLTQGHTVSNQKNWGFDPDLPDS